MTFTGVHWCFNSREVLIVSKNVRMDAEETTRRLYHIYDEPDTGKQERGGCDL